MSDSPSAPQRPVLGNRYELYRRIARGGMAEVYLARDLQLDRPVAVKVLFPEYATDPAFVERFRREAQAAANLAHPAIVAVHDWGAERGTYYIVMEYVEGQSLAEILRANGPLDAGRSAEIVADIAGGLGLAHANGVVHRDVKPGNVLISRNGHTKVTDFGIARAVSGPASEGLTQTGAVMGTATYLSPEQAQGHQADPRSDVYSLAVVLYEMLTGRPPFTGDTPVAIAYKHVKEAPTPPRQLNASIPAGIEAICIKGLAKEPEARYASAEELRADLRRFLQGETPAALAATAAPTPAPPAPAGPGYEATTAIPAGASGAVRTYDTPDGLPPLPPESEPSRTGLYVGGIAAALVLIAILVVVLVNSLIGGDDGEPGTDTTTSVAPEVVEVPSVEGLDLTVAENQLRELGFEVEVDEREDDTVPQGEVISQNPRAGINLTTGESVLLIVSAGQGMVDVPALVGLSEGEARIQLRDLGLSPDIRREFDPDTDPDTVLEQNPPAGQQIQRGESVSLVISDGAQTVVVPDVTGISANQAELELARLGLGASIIEEPDDEVERGLVLRTEPAAEATVDRDSEVTVVVSSGPETVEILDFVGVGVDTVRLDLQRQGFEFEINEVELSPGDPNIGRVIRTDPPAGIEALPGFDVIILDVGVEEEPTTTTTSTTTTTTSTTTTTTTTTTPPDEGGGGGDGGGDGGGGDGG